MKNYKNVDEVIIGAPWKITENLIKSFNISIVVSVTLLIKFTIQFSNNNL